MRFWEDGGAERTKEMGEKDEQRGFGGRWEEEGEDK